MNNRPGNKKVKKAQHAKWYLQNLGERPAKGAALGATSLVDGIRRKDDGGVVDLAHTSASLGCLLGN